MMRGLFGGIAALVLVAAGSPVGDGTPVAATSPAPTASSSPETQLFPGASLTWTLGDSSPFPDADASTPLIPWRDGFAAGGTVGTGDGLDGAVWLSDATGTWTRVQDPVFADSSVMWMAASDEVLLAFGPVGQSITNNQEWLSTDGRSWSSITLPDAFSDALISSVDYGPAGFLLSAVTENDPTAITALSPDGRNWVLGRSWTGGRSARGPFGPLDPTEGIWTSVSSLGYLAWLPLHQQPSWLSSDGLHWQPLTGTNAEDIEFIRSASDGYLATVGESRHCRIWQCGGDGDYTLPTYRQSPDGKTWTNLPPQHLPPEDAVDPGQLLSDGHTFLVIDLYGHTWSSADGLEWQPDHVYVPDAATLTASDSLHFCCSGMALGTFGLASLEWDGQSTTIPWFATFSAAPAPSALPFPSPVPVPEEISLLDSAPYQCAGSSPLSILWSPAHAEDDPDAAAAALRTIVSGGDPTSASMVSGFPSTGWLRIDQAPDRVTYLHTDGPPDFRNSSFVVVKRAADGTWGFGGLGSGGRFQCTQHTKQAIGARWRLAARPSPSDRSLHAEVQLLSCGRPSPAEITPRAKVIYGRDLIDIIVTTPPIDTGDVACYQWYPFTINLDQPVGDRSVFDSSAFPLVQRWPK